VRVGEASRPQRGASTTADGVPHVTGTADRKGAVCSNWREAPFSDMHSSGAEAERNFGEVGSLSNLLFFTGATERLRLSREESKSGSLCRCKNHNL